MLRSLNTVVGSAIVATDGDIGKVFNFLVEDISWRIAYLVVETGGWLRKKRVLLSPDALRDAAWDRKVLSVNLTVEQVQDSPDVDTDQPVSKQQEMALSKYYGWSSLVKVPAEPLEDLMTGDPHLRSCRELVGYRVSCEGEPLGEVEEFLFDDKTWTIRFLMTRTGIDEGKHALLVPTDGAHDISWTYKSVNISHPVVG
jgi:uncharacterized protein YrrD